MTPNLCATSYRFEFGTSAALGQQTPETAVGDGSAPVAVSATLTGLTASTTYFFRVVATNADGTSVGTTQSFKTAANPPPPFAGLSISTQTVRLSSKREAPVRVSCPAATAGRCQGTLSLAGKLPAKKGKKAKTVKLGSASFSVVSGQRATVKVKVSTSTVAAVAKAKKLATTATASAKDSLGRSKTTTGKVSLQPAKKKKKS